MWQRIKAFFGFEKLCHKTERQALVECSSGENVELVKKHINRFIKARKDK